MSSSRLVIDSLIINKDKEKKLMDEIKVLNDENFNILKDFTLEDFYSLGINDLLFLKDNFKKELSGNNNFEMTLDVKIRENFNRAFYDKAESYVIRYYKNNGAVYFPELNHIKSLDTPIKILIMDNLLFHRNVLSTNVSNFSPVCVRELREKRNKLLNRIEEYKGLKMPETRWRESIEFEKIYLDILNKDLIKKYKCKIHTLWYLALNEDLGKVSGNLKQELIDSGIIEEVYTIQNECCNNPKYKICDRNFKEEQLTKEDVEKLNEHKEITLICKSCDNEIDINSKLLKYHLCSTYFIREIKGSI